MEKVLAMRADGSVSYCVCPPDQRGKGRCDHIYHQELNESVEQFLNRVSFAISSNSEEDEKSIEEITKELIENNKLSFNEAPDWEEVVSPSMLARYLKIGDTAFEGKCYSKLERNENGDLVDHLYIVGSFDGFEFYEGAEDPAHQPCDFGCVPHINEDGTFTMNGIAYRCLPVVSRDKVGYGQGYNIEGEETIWLYQRDGNLAITMPVNGDTCKIFGKEYSKAEIESAINNPPHKDPKIALLISCLDPMIKERCPEFGQEGWMSALSERFEKDKINDLEWRRVYTYKDQVQKELEAQVKRMGGTLRKSIVDGKDPILYQKNNTDNVLKNLRGRSNVQLAETLNPLSAYSQSHKVTLVGIEGYNKDNCPDALRMVSDSQRGICDPLDQSSGKGVGLSIFLKGSDVQNGVIVRDSSKDCYSLSDFVPYRTHNNPNRVSMATSQMRQAMILTEGEDPRKLGDEISDKAWASISGSNMGRNLRIAYLAGEKQWEDSAMISESAAKKLSARKIFTFSKDSKYKDGSEVHVGDKVAGKEVKYDGVLRKTSSGFTMEVNVPFTPGNKIAGRFGNKCTVGKITPDDEMPEIWDSQTKSYKRAEVIMSPLSIGKRGNIGAILETQNESLSSGDIVPVRMPNGKTVRANNGTQFIMRLNQISQEKNHSYDGELNESREARSRFGEMESMLLTTTERRRKVLNFLKNQGTDEEARLDSLLKAIGIKKS